MEALIKDYVLEENLLVKYELEDVAENEIPDDLLLPKEEILTEDEGELDLKEDFDGHGGTGRDSSTVFEMVVAADCDKIEIKEEIWSDSEWVLEEDAASGCLRKSASPTQPEDEDASPTQPEDEDASPTQPENEDASPTQPEDGEANPTHEQSEARSSPPPETNTEHEYEVKDGALHCKFCNFKSTSEWTLQRHLLGHRPIIEDGAPLFACSQCQYKTRIMHNLQMHSGVHKKKEEEDCRTTEQEYEVKDEIFHCKLCKFKSKVEWTVQRHLLVHRFKMKKDSLKPLKRKYKKKVKRGPLEDGQKSFGCDQCSYKTRYKFNLKVHSRVHKKKEEADLHGCEDQQVDAHAERDADQPSSRPADFSCTLCEFKTKSRRSLNLHRALSHKDQVRLRDSEEAKELLECPKCSYRTRHQGNLKIHSLGHTEKGWTSVTLIPQTLA